jgi:hypothetical protein
MTGPDLLPDVPGLVHGIKSVNPPKVQCDGCGHIATGDRLNLVILTCGIRFNPHVGDGRRLCRDCAKEAGWEAR